MTVPAPVGIGAALLILAAVAGLVLALAVTRLDLGVARRDLRRQGVELVQADNKANALTVERDEALTRVVAIQRAMHQQRINTYTLLGRIKQLEGDNEPATPLPSQILADDVVAEAEAILRQVGGQS